MFCFGSQTPTDNLQIGGQESFALFAFGGSSEPSLSPVHLAHSLCQAYNDSWTFKNMIYCKKKKHEVKILVPYKALGGLEKPLRTSKLTLIPGIEGLVKGMKNLVGSVFPFMEVPSFYLWFHLVHSLAHLQTTWNLKEVYDKYLNYECEGGFPDMFAGSFMQSILLVLSASGAHGVACSGTAGKFN